MVEGRQAPLFARSSSDPDRSRVDAERHRLQAEVDRLRRECQRLERERDRLRKEKWDTDRALGACEWELSMARFRDEMRSWWLSVFVPLGFLIVMVAIAARR